jgi:hypothetical protein
MTGPGTVLSGAKAPLTGGMDRWISRAAAATVAGLAGIAEAISYSHMRQLAQDHGQAGWHAHAFPLSVDGIEIVASLVLLADRRAGRRSGWLPWAALVIGTVGSRRQCRHRRARHDQPGHRGLAGPGPADRGQAPVRHARPAPRVPLGGRPVLAGT